MTTHHTCPEVSSCQSCCPGRVASCWPPSGHSWRWEASRCCRVHWARAASWHSGDDHHCQDHQRMIAHLMKGSLPLMLSWCQGLGLLSSSDTEPWDRPSTNSPKSWKLRFRGFFTILRLEVGIKIWFTGHVYCKKWEYWIEQNSLIKFYVIQRPSRCTGVFIEEFHLAFNISFDLNALPISKPQNFHLINSQNAFIMK